MSSRRSERPGTATGTTFTINFPEMQFYILDPLNPEAINQFLSHHQLSHNEINDRLGTTGNDLEDVDFANDNERRAWLDLNFTEHQTWVTATGPSEGKATITIDGVSKGTIDLYSPTVNWRVPEAFTGLTSGAHTILVTVLGTKDRAATGTQVVVDAFVVDS